MKKAFGEYRRLARGAFGCSSLWAGKEHLLYVKGTGLLMPVVEEYSRVRYRDITAVSVTETRTSVVLVAIATAGFLLTLLGVLGTVSGSSLDPDGNATAFGFTVVLIGVGILAAVGFLTVLLWNLIRGRSVIFAIHTVGGVTKIRAANRLRRAQALRAEIINLVNQRHAGAGVPGADPGAKEVPPPGVQAEGDVEGDGGTGMEKEPPPVPGGEGVDRGGTS